MIRRSFLKSTLAGLMMLPAVRNAQALMTRFGRTTSSFAVNIETFRFDNAPPHNRMELIAELGFTGIEFWNWADKNLDEMIAVRNDLGMDIVQFVCRGFVNHPDLHDDFLANLREAIPVAERLGVNQLTVIPGNRLDDLTFNQQIQACIDGYRKAVPICEEAGITLMVEPLNERIDHKGILITRSEDAARLIREVDSPFIRMLYDVYHQQVTEGNLINTIEAYYRNEALIHYFQIADNPGRNEPGRGEINYRRILESIYQMGYRGYIGLELRPHATEAEALQAVVNADQW